MKDTISDKVHTLPDSLAQEVSDFIDFLLMKRDRTRWSRPAGWTQFSESVDIAESDFSEYLGNLEDYENRLARGEINW